MHCMHTFVDTLLHKRHVISSHAGGFAPRRALLAVGAQAKLLAAVLDTRRKIRLHNA